MSVVKVIELMAQSEKSWEEAAATALREASKSVRNIKSLYIQDLQAKVDGNKITAFKVTAKISFVVE